MGKYILLNRDGVINVKQDHPIAEEKDFVLLPFATEAFFAMKRFDFLPIILACEEGLQNGSMDEATQEAIQERMRNEIETAGGYIHDIIVCPSAMAPWDKCAFPKPGMLQIAAYKHGFSLEDTYFIGDRLECLQAAWAVGCKSGLVRTGKPYRTMQYLKTADRGPDLITIDLLSMINKLASMPTIS